MGGKLVRELHKSRPFDSVAQEVFLNVVRTADHFMRAFEDLLKPYNLSSTQYNVLRILRGVAETTDPTATGPNAAAARAEPSNGEPASAQIPGPGIPCKVISEHMITRDPDITRLLDRLESRHLITRRRDTRDRRVVTTCITPEGLRILKELDHPVLEFHRLQLAHMPESKLAQLIDLLETARTTP